MSTNFNFNRNLPSNIQSLNDGLVFYNENNNLGFKVAVLGQA